MGVVVSAPQAVPWEWQVRAWGPLSYPRAASLQELLGRLVCSFCVCKTAVGTPCLGDPLISALLGSAHLLASSSSWGWPVPTAGPSGHSPCPGAEPPRRGPCPNSTRVKPCPVLGVLSPSLGQQPGQGVGGPGGGEQEGWQLTGTAGPLGSGELPGRELVPMWPRRAVGGQGPLVLLLAGHLRTKVAGPLPRKVRLCPHGRSPRRSCALCWGRCSRLCTRSPRSTFWTEPYSTGPRHPPTTCPFTAVRGRGRAVALLSPSLWLWTSASCPDSTAHVHLQADTAPPREPGGFLRHVGGQGTPSQLKSLRLPQNRGPGAGGGVCGDEPQTAQLWGWGGGSTWRPPALSAERLRQAAHSARRSGARSAPCSSQRPPTPFSAASPGSALCRTVSVSLAAWVTRTLGHPPSVS